MPSLWNIQNKNGNVAVLYGSPNQNNDEFHDFISESENMVNTIKSHFITVLGVFNARLPSCWSKGTVTSQCSHKDPLATT